jgi:TPR repeat protein
MYFLGQGVERDYRESFRWAHKAAEQGLPAAQTNVAYLYEHGLGTPLDYTAAFAWYSRASRGGNQSAALRLASLRQIMTPRQLELASALLNPQPTASTAAPLPAPQDPPILSNHPLPTGSL